MTLLSAYHSLGFSLVPIAGADKKPLVPWKEYTTRLPTSDELSEWFDGPLPEDGGNNIGIVTGSVSGIVVLDIDGPAGEESLRSLGDVPETATVRTGKGRHLYFRHPGNEIRNFAGKLPGLDLRGDGGYVVAPPSIHANGSRYEWELHPEAVGIAEVPAWLLSLIHEDEKLGRSGIISGGQLQRHLHPRVSRTAKQDIDRLIGELVLAVEGNRNDTLNRVAYHFGQHCATGQLDEIWARNELLKWGLQIGLSDKECIATIDSGFAAGMKQPLQPSEPALSILDAAPETMDRPIRLIDGKAYGATWVPVGAGDMRQSRPDYALAVFGDKGTIYSERNITESLPLNDLPFFVDLPHRPVADKLLSPVGLRRWINCQVPSPASVLYRVVKGVDAFVSFERSLSDQRGMCELIACWIMGTYVLDAFDVVGYLWPTGERGSGKTQLLNTVSALAYLGRTITSGSSFAAIRDEADYGATIAFDDCENVRSMDNDKRELLLAGNMRGTQISLKEAIGEGEWQTRYINNFAPRLFSSIGLPDDVLGSRTISIPCQRRSKIRPLGGAKVGHLALQAWNVGRA